MYFHCFLMIFPLKRTWLFIGKNLNSLHSRLFCARVEIGVIVLEKNIFNFISIFSLFRNYLPLDKDVALPFNKLVFSLPKDAVCLVRLKLTLWFLRNRKCEKCTDGRTDDGGQHTIRKTQLSF